MATDCRDAEVAGLWVEVYDTAGTYVGHTVYFDWHDRPLPSVGDIVTLELRSSTGNNAQQVESRVCARQFDLQEDEDGQPAVWVRLIGRQCRSRHASRPKSPRFSAN